PAIGGEVEVEIDGVAVQAVEPDGVPAHDQAVQPDGFQRGDDLGQAGFGAHRIESSQPRLPCARTRFRRGCLASSSLLKGPRSRARTSGIAASGYFSSASW